ncbi:MAG: flagellar M-ring protein FliF [Clostridiales bacterium]|jgi:flagellar M-ring protein FliF|nr:flagellar M-ring protein FliF [Clostridiales bacterium]
MASSLKAINQKLNQFWDKLNSTQKKVLVIALVSFVVVLAISAFLLSREEFVVLYSGLNQQEAAEIYSKLRELGVQPKIEGISTILVPKNKEAEIRMQLAAEGYPRSGFNYDILFDNSSFGQTGDEKRMLQIIQLQERLSQSIRFLEGVDNAVVTIAMPESDDFVIKSQEIPVTASVIIKTKPGYNITPQQANNIIHLVAKSVPGLKDENITIIDTNMNVLSGKASDENQILGNQFDLEYQVEERIKDQIIDLLEPVFGYKKVVATVNVKLNFDKRLRESVTFEPVTDEEGIIASREVLREKVRNVVPEGAAGEPSNTPQYPELESGESGSYDKSHEIINYEINEIKETIEEQQGKVEDLSISVIIDNEALDQQLLQQIKELLATAIGTDLERITVHSMKFDTSLQDKLLEELEQRMNGTWRMTDITPFLLAGIAVLFVILIIIWIRMRRAHAQAAAAQELLAEAAERELQQEKQELELDMEDRNQIRKQLERLASQQPEAVAQLLRNWLSEE